VLQCVAVRCSVLQCVAVHCSASVSCCLHAFASCCSGQTHSSSVLHIVAVCCRASHYIVRNQFPHVAVDKHIFAVCGSVLQWTCIYASALHIYIHVRIPVHTGIHTYTHTYINWYIELTFEDAVDKHIRQHVTLVGSSKLQISFAEYSLFYSALFQKRPVI